LSVLKVLAGSLLLFSAGAAAQAQPDTRSDAPGTTGTGVTPSLPSRSSGTGRDQFIAPVIGIQIQGDGLNLPPEAEEEAKPAAKPEAEAKPVETKEPGPRSTGK
jgi:hypothetical protein